MPNVNFLETADRIGRRLCRDAVWAGGECNWLGWGLEVVGASWTPVYRAQSANVYDGTAGIALFLARLHQFTKDHLQKAAAIGALNHAFAGMDGIHEGMRASVYSGCAGIAYAAIEIGEALGDERMIARGIRELRDSRNTKPNETTWLDIISGCAGAIQVLLDIARRYNAAELRDVAMEHGQMLLRKASKRDIGWSWDTLPGTCEKHLLGYGHGAGGIGCALLELWKATGEHEYEEAARQAFRYERSHFSAEQHNWPDLRSAESYGVPSTQPIFAMAWCHGAPGIGLSRLRAHELLPADQDIFEELSEAVQSTAAACSMPLSSGGNLSLCHGLGGNADLLIATGDSLDRADFRQVAEAAGQHAIAQIATNDMPWPCGVNGGGETPNLMLGISGIGHFFLRLYDSARVPSIVLLRGGPVEVHKDRSLTVAAD
jgi:class II lanthipeptide synthase